MSSQPNPVPSPAAASADTPPTVVDGELAELVAALRARPGDDQAQAWAERLESAATRLAGESDALKRRLLAGLSVNHDINNALVGVVGNAQLLGLGPAAALPGVKERLEVIARESNRIKLATQRLAELKHALLIEGRSQGRGQES